jgi:ATP-dependent protease ClpP protease subunit
MRKSQAAGENRPWYRIENHVLDEANSNGEKAVIYIYDEIGDSWWGESTNASDFVKELSALKVQNIELHLNSPGGDIFEGVAIYQALKAHDAQVHVIVDALAASAASFIAQAGDKITMTRAATMMIHDGSGLVWGNAADMRSTADLLDKLSNTIADIYSARAGETVDFWRNMMIQETWFNSQEAVDAGLADEVGSETDKQDEEAATNKWDLSVFNHAGRKNAPSPIEVRTRIANQFKEKAVKPGNTNTEPGAPEQPDQTTADTEGEVPPANAPVTEEQPGEGAPATPTAPPVTTTPPEGGEAGGTADPSPTNSAALFTFQVDGKPVQMTLAQAAARMTDLQTFQYTTLEQGRKDFVKQLHDDKKIVGPQVKATEEFALGLSSDQYDAWKATWDGAAAIPMLGAHGEGGGDQNGGGISSDEAIKLEEIDRCKAIVRSFKQSNMKNEVIEKTNPYKTLMTLDPTFKL